MKRTRIFLSVIVMALCLLATVSARAMLPQDGIYKKKDGNGNVTARMFVITLDGKAAEAPNEVTMKTSGGAPIIALQALDANGNVTEELATCYSWKTDTAGAGETGLRLRGEAMRNAEKKNSKFTPEIFSTAFGQQVEFGFVNEGRATAYHCSDALNGEYVKDPDATYYYPLSALLYAYEKTFNFHVFYNAENTPPNTYSLSDEQEGSPWHGDYYALNVSNPKQQDMWTLTAEKGLRIVMENRQRDYRFLFVSKRYHGDPSWVGITWGAFTGTAMTSTNALYLHRYITLNAPEMLDNPNTFFRLTDFYSGEGPNAVTTNAFSVLLKNSDGSYMRLGKADVGDNNMFRFGKMMGRAAIKGDGVRIREQPNTNCAILGEKDNGFPLTVEGFVNETGDRYNSFTWAKVRLDEGTTGYVNGQFIQDIDTPFN